MITALLVGAALADSAGTLPAGSTAGWLGAGLGSFRHLRHADGTVQPLDRAVQGRVEAWYGAGVTDWLELSASLPLVANGVRVIDGNPCVGARPTEDYCDPVVGVGRATLGVKAGLEPGEVDLALGLVGATDAWLADRRGRWTSTSDGTWDLRVSGALGRDFNRLRLDGWAALTVRSKRELIVGDEALRVPANHVDGGLQVSWWHHGWGVRAEGTTVHRLGGLQRDGTWVTWARPSEDRFAALQYRDVQLGLQGSRALARGWTVHAGARRVVWVRNGPTDRWDLALAVSRYVAQ